MPKSVQNYFEPCFGYDFSQVRMHPDTRAAETARAVNARAYTLGQYTPKTMSGRRLMAHELTHVVQQTNVENSASQER